MEIFTEIIDRLLQFFGQEFLHRFINHCSEYLTRIVSIFLKIYLKKNSKTDDSLKKLVTLHRSENFLIVNKPPDLLINSNDPEKISVQTLLKESYPQLCDESLCHEFYFAHRLDYSTSGILCLPLNRLACRTFCKSLENRLCSKYYVALVNGHISKDIQTISIHIGEDVRFQKTNKKMCTVLEAEVCQHPREAITKIAVISRGKLEGKSVTKVLIKLATGRRHQIRVHLKAIGHPILGDYTYGLQHDLSMQRMYLHAIRLKVPNSVEDICIETEDPFIHKMEGIFNETKINNNLDKYYDLLENDC